MDALDLNAMRGLVVLNDMTDFAARLCEAPTALVSMVEETEQLFSHDGFDPERTPRGAILLRRCDDRAGMMVVPDVMLIRASLPIRW
ncbi:hypothetical protein AB5I41_21920 [Sphingomonas sp. MMS24-JH45]